MSQESVMKRLNISRVVEEKYFPSSRSRTCPADEAPEFTARQFLKLRRICPAVDWKMVTTARIRQEDEVHLPHSPFSISAVTSTTDASMN